ncbi:zinc finger protein 260-like isoform X2 [Chironomus tepperi]|uniref:zinc finger protein 260-like isoform X2 n=1 Tax=Chironomus tepperi TaxID=113505 RepID=UPI00391FB912
MKKASLFIKQEPEFHDDTKEEIIGIFGTVDDCYCRVCFKIFSVDDSRNEIDMGTMSMLREILQLGLKLSNGSQWICGSCSTKLNSFWTFKYDVIDKQAKFSQLVLKNLHRDVEEIQNLNNSLNISDVQADVLVKSEPEFTAPDFSEDTSDVPRKRIKTSRVTPKKYKKHKAPQTCEICGKVALNLLNHKIKKHGLKYLFECNYCTFSSYEKKKLQLHIHDSHIKPKKKADPDQHESQVCPHCAKQVRHLDEHIANIHCGERNYFCDLCPFSSYRKKPIEQHMMNVHLPKSVKCSLCDFITINMDRLRKHIRNQHEERERTTEYMCNVPECNKIFRNKFNLQCHVKRCHEGEVKFLCDSPGCNKSFFSRSEQRIHYENSHGPKTVVCEECGNSFSSAAMLRKHSSLHREYQHLCTFPNCGLKYRTATQLKNHVNRIHLERREYECKECTSAFYTMRDLDRHIISKHLGIKFVCEVPGCNSTLSRRDAYLSHLKSHSGLTEDERRELISKLNEFCMQLNLKR